MEPAKIDWKSVESVFVEDKLYENINAPKWVDFLTREDDDSMDDEAWFCKPGIYRLSLCSRIALVVFFFTVSDLEHFFFNFVIDCEHPKTAEDFFRITPTSKVSILNFSDVLCFIYFVW